MVSCIAIIKLLCSQGLPSGFWLGASVPFSWPAMPASQVCGRSPQEARWDHWIHQPGCAQGSRWVGQSALPPSVGLVTLAFEHSSVQSSLGQSLESFSPLLACRCFTSRRPGDYGVLYAAVAVWPTSLGRQSTEPGSSCWSETQVSGQGENLTETKSCVVLFSETHSKWIEDLIASNFMKIVFWGHSKFILQYGWWISHSYFRWWLLFCRLKFPAFLDYQHTSKNSLGCGCPLWTRKSQNPALAQDMHQAFCKEFYTMVHCKVWLNLYRLLISKNSFIVHDSTFSCWTNKYYYYYTLCTVTQLQYIMHFRIRTPPFIGLFQLPYEQKQNKLAVSWIVSPILVTF